MNAVVRTRSRMRCGSAAAASLAYTAVIPLALLLAFGTGLASEPAPTDQLAGGCLQGTGASRPNQVERYPATTSGKVEGVQEKQTLDVRFIAQYPPPLDTTAWTTWWRAEPHPYFSAVLPGTRLLAVDWAQPGSYISAGPGFQRKVFVDFHDTLYELPRLNYALAAAGFSFDSADAPKAARLAVLWTLLEQDAQRKRYTVHGPRPGPDLRVGKVDSIFGIPAVEFYSVRVGRWPHPRRQGPTPGVLVDCSIGGHRRVMFVEFQPTYGGGWQLEDISDTLGGAPRMHFRGVWPPPAVSPERRGEGPSVDYPWVLVLAGDTWPESEGQSGPVHCFILADLNGQATGSSMQFKVSAQTQAVYIRFKRMQTRTEYFRLAVKDPSTDTWRLTYSPDYDSTAEYEVYATDQVNGNKMTEEILVDPEAWRTLEMQDGPSWVVVHYMKYNDEMAPDAAATAESVALGLEASWDTLVHLWCQGDDLPVDDDDTLDVFMGTLQSAPGLPWFHVPWSDAHGVFHPPGTDYALSSRSDLDYYCIYGQGGTSNYVSAYDFFWG